MGSDSRCSPTVTHHRVAGPVDASSPGNDLDLAVDAFRQRPPDFTELVHPPPVRMASLSALDRDDRTPFASQMLADHRLVRRRCSSGVFHVKGQRTRRRLFHVPRTRLTRWICARFFRVDHRPGWSRSKRPWERGQFLDRRNACVTKSCFASVLRRLVQITSRCCAQPLSSLCLCRPRSCRPRFRSLMSMSTK